MASKKLALTNGILGLAGGIYLTSAPLLWFFFNLVILNGNFSYDVFATNTLLLLAISYLVSFATLTMGIIGIVKFKESQVIPNAPSVLLIVGGSIALFPVAGWPGGIVAIVGGALYLSKLKNFNEPTAE